MFRLKSISLFQFKSHRLREFDFGSRITGITGLNGTGKTNLLDAIYYLCVGKSHFSAADTQVITRGLSGFRLQGHFELPPEGAATIAAVLRETGRKELSWNGAPYARLSDHVGRLPVVIIAPDDIAVITGASEERRRLTDALFCQQDAGYLRNLMDYNRVLQQRNSHLRILAESGSRGDLLLDTLDNQLSALGALIFEHRYRHLPDYLAEAAQHYRVIAGEADDLALQYHSPLLEAGAAPADAKAQFARLLSESRLRDIAQRRTTAGIHRDDLLMTLNALPFRQMASQGQRKSLLFALKLTEFEWLQRHKGFAPILLLDDVFEKLDAARMRNLLNEVCIDKQGQVFITDTDSERLGQSLALIQSDYALVSC